MVHRVALLACAVLTFSSQAWSQDTRIPKLKVFGIELGSNISKYKNATRISKTSYSIPKSDFDVPPLFSEDFTFDAMVTENGTIFGIVAKTERITENSSKVVDAVIEAYPKVKRNRIGIEELARGDIGNGYTISVLQSLSPHGLYAACAHTPTYQRLEESQTKKNARGL